LPALSVPLANFHGYRRTHPSAQASQYAYAVAGSSEFAIRRHDISTKYTSPAYRIVFVKKAQEPFESIFVFLVTSTLLDRGWSMKLSSTVFLFLFAIALTRADNQQIQQLCVNAATCLLAVRSGLSPGRKSDLQMHRTPSAFGDYRVMFVSDTGRTVS
jgi:hypothetical protein